MKNLEGRALYQSFGINYEPCGQGYAVVIVLVSHTAITSYDERETTQTTI